MTAAARDWVAEQIGDSPSSDNRASFSNYGSGTDIFGPGVNVTSLSTSSSGTDTSAESANGTWKLRVRGLCRFDAGSIEGFGITF